MLGEPARVNYPIPDAIDPREKFLICKRNDSIETVVQSDSTPDRAQHSVDVLNEHEVLNNRSPNYYWRLRKVSETNEEVRRNWRARNTRVQFESYEKYRQIPSDLRITA